MYFGFIEDEEHETHIRFIQALPARGFVDIHIGKFVLPFTTSLKYKVIALVTMSKQVS